VTTGAGQHGIPSPGNANYAWIQHFLAHLATGGTAGCVMANGVAGRFRPTSRAKATSAQAQREELQSLPVGGRILGK